MVLAALAAPVARALPVIASRIPPGPAAELSRLAIPVPERPRSLVSGLFFDLADPATEPAVGPVVEALRALGPLRAERLLGALELTLADFDLAGAPDLSAYLSEPPERQRGVALTVSGQSETETAAVLLENFRPGAADLAALLTRQLAGHPLIAPQLAVPSDATDEASIAAAHGARHLALAVAIASAVVGQWRAPVAGSRAAAVTGVGIGAAMLLLSESPMPAGYAAALLDRARAEYLLPAWGSAQPAVSDHLFALAEGSVPATADFSGNGLVTVVPGGALIRTGVGDGTVQVSLRVVTEEPALEERSWDEVVEVSWRAAVGQACVTGLDRRADWPRSVTTPPWPGDYRLRVHATGRDDADQNESYELVVWQAPAAPEIVYKRTDALGYRLRGEPDLVRPAQPERAYRWVDDSSLQVAATVTVITGSNEQHALRAFGADPAQPLVLSAVEYSDEMWVAMLETPGAVIAIEINGFQGSDQEVLCRASASGRAASMFWNVNGLTRLSFAEGGRVVVAFELGMESPEEAEAVPSVAAALDGLDFEDYRHTNAKGLVAVERFTGRGLTPQDLERIEDAGIAYRITTG